MTDRSIVATRRDSLAGVRIVENELRRPAPRWREVQSLPADAARKDAKTKRAGRGSSRPA